jgi:hypothetical protein
MATRATPRRSDAFDHLFFSGMAVAILASAFVEFAHSYYLQAHAWSLHI